MDDSKNDDVIRFDCQSCQAEFQNLQSLSEHRISCSGEHSQSSTTGPKLFTKTLTEGTDFKRNLLQSLPVEPILADADTATQLKRQAYELAVTAAKETSRHFEVLKRIKTQKDSIHAELMESRARLRSAIESKASKSDRFIYKTRMNHASEAMALLLKREECVSAEVQKATIKQAAAMKKVLEAMSVERTIFKCAVDAFSLQAEIQNLH